jgi:hypothetical protein
MIGNCLPTEADWATEMSARQAETRDLIDHWRESMPDLLASMPIEKRRDLEGLGRTRVTDGPRLLHPGISDDVIRPSAAERNANPRSSSAKPRWALRAADSPLTDPTP